VKGLGLLCFLACVLWLDVLIGFLWFFEGNCEAVFDGSLVWFVFDFGFWVYRLGVCAVL
jgi:hypothetical protein